MILEKVYDELYGMIEDLKKKVAGISGGTTVTITPALESGVKVADYTIDEESGVLYAPSNAIVYSTLEREIGVWLDGSTPVYECSFEITGITVTTSGVKISSLDITGMDILVSAHGVSREHKHSAPLAAYRDSGDLGVSSSLSISIDTIILRYTKTTEAKKTTKKK